MNIDFAHHAGFSAYVLLLMFSGVVMLVMGSPAVKTESMMLRALNVLFGLGFVGYGFYLAFLFQGGSYLIFFKAFILPFLMIIRTLRSAKARPAAPAVGVGYPQAQYQPVRYQPARYPQGQFPQAQLPPQFPQGQYPQGQFPQGENPQGQNPPAAAPESGFTTGRHAAP